MDRRIVLDEEHVAHQTGPRVRTFEQVVAEDLVLRQPIVECALKRIDVVDALSDERALLEHVLIDVGDRTRVWIDAGLAAKPASEPRARDARHTDADARLQDRVTRGHATRALVVTRAVERVPEGRRQHPRRIARQLGIAVERDHVLHRCQALDGTDDGREPSQLAAQRRVELLELAALALPPHPHALARIPAPRAMEQEESLPVRGRVLDAERFDRRHRACKQGRIPGRGLGRRIAEVRDQRERQVAIAVREEPHLERLDQVIDLLCAADQGRDRHHRAMRVGDPRREVETREQARMDQERGSPLHDSHRELTRAHGEQRAPRHEQRSGNMQRRDREREHRREHTDDGGRAGVRTEPMTPQPATNERDRRSGYLDRSLEDAPSVLEQEVADVGRTPCCGALRQADRRSCDLGLARAAAFRDRFDDVAILIARAEVHCRIVRIGAQRCLDDTHRLHEQPPVGRAQIAQAADAVADRDLICGLALRRELEHVLDGFAALGEPLLEPREREHERRTMPLQSTRELRGERIGDRDVRLDQLGEDQHHALGSRGRDLDHAAHPGRRLLALSPPCGHLHDHAPQVLDHREPQHDRDRPQLAEAQRLDLLIRGDKRTQGFVVDAAVRVRDQLERDVIDARRSRRGRVREPRQLAAVCGREVLPRGADLLLDQVEVIEEPLGRRRDLAATPYGIGDEDIRIAQRILVVGKSIEQRVTATVPELHLVPARDRARVPFELTNAEQLRTQRRRLDLDRPPTGWLRGHPVPWTPATSQARA